MSYRNGRCNIDGCSTTIKVIYIKYKDIVYIHCFGPKDDYSALNKARYSSNGLKMNSKVFIFNLGTGLYNLSFWFNCEYFCNDPSSLISLISFFILISESLEFIK
jgi:hypothetical protein